MGKIVVDGIEYRLEGFSPKEKAQFLNYLANAQKELNLALKCIKYNKEFSSINGSSVRSLEATIGYISRMEYVVKNDFSVILKPVKVETSSDYHYYRMKFFFDRNKTGTVIAKTVISLSDYTKNGKVNEDQFLKDLATKHPDIAAYVNNITSIEEITEEEYDEEC